MSYVVKKSSLKKEFKSTTVRDKRQIKSLQRISECVEKNQGKSYSSSCGKSLRQNGGRIFGDKKMNIENMQNGHYKETIKRVKNENILLLPQDTSTLNYTGHVATTGLGCIGTKKDMQGLLMHTMMILNTDGLPLGIIGQKIWARDDNDFGKKHRRKKLNIKDKESYKWIEGMQWALDRLASKLKKTTEIWVIGDKESDIYELISQDKPDNVKLLIRAYQPRRVEVEKDNTYKKLTEFIEDLPENTTKTVELERENRTEKIELVVSYGEATILAPEYKKKELKRQKKTMGIVYAREKGNEGSGIKWILLADKICLNAEDALTILDYYAHRWKIERLHYVLKQGLKIEDFQFDTAEKLTNAVAMYTVIAWYIMWITYYSRSIPEGIPSIIIDDTEKDILEAYTGKDIKTVLRAVMAIAILGGFIGGSKRYPHPGVKSIWIGIQKLEAMKQGWLLAKDHFP